MNTRMSSFSDNIIIEKLPNGMTVLLESLPYLHSASTSLWIKTGSINEPDENAGISHFIEHLLFKGTESRTPRQLVEAIESHGGHLNAFTAREYTCVYAKTLDKHITTSIEILADIVKNSLLNDVEKERNVILEEIASIEDMPEDFVHDLFLRNLWPDNPLGRAITGSVETVSTIDMDALKSYYSQWYQPQNMYFSAVGNFDPDKVIKQIRLEFEGLSRGAEASNDLDVNFGSGISAVDKSIGQSHLCFGFPGPTSTDENRFMYDMLSSILGGGSTSRLFEKIREEEGLAYSIYSYTSSYMASGLFGIYAAVAISNLNKTIDLAFAELRKLRDDTLSNLEVENNCEQLKGNLLMALESTFNRMTRMVRSMMYYDRVIPVEEIVEILDAVSAEDIQGIALDIFQPEKCVMSVVGPDAKQIPQVIAL